MDKVLKTMDPSKISEIMDKFEKQFEDLDVSSEYMQNSMGNTTSLTTSEDEVNTLLTEVCEENNLKISSDIDVGIGKKKITETDIQSDELSTRLKN